MMPKWTLRLDQWLESAERWLAVGLYLLLLSLIGVNIVARNVWHMASHRLIELAPTVVLWLALVGATLALKSRRHIKIELALRFLPTTGRRWAHIVTTLFSMGVCGLLACASIPFLINEIVLFGTWGWLAICFPIFFGVAFFRFGLHLFIRHCPPEETP